MLDLDKFLEITKDVDIPFSDGVESSYSIKPEGVIDNRSKDNPIVTPQPLWVSRILYNIETGTQKVELSFIAFDEVRTILVSMEQISSTSKIVALSNSGILVNSNNARAIIKYLSTAITESADVIPRAKTKSVLGWAGAEFVPYSKKVLFDGEESFGHIYRAINEKYPSSLWAAQVKQYRKQLPVRLCMAASFASPLVEIIGANPFVFHLWGGTGVGKTVVLMIAASIWGDPSMGKLVRTLNMTQNALLSTAAFLNNLPFVGDELQTIKSQWTNYDKLIMCITEGVDRGRMSYDKLNEMKSWRCAFITSGEEPCVKRNSGGGTKNRVIEVEATEKLIPNGNGTANFVREHYGAAGREFIESLDRKAARKMYKDLRESFPEELENKITDKQISTATLMLVADELSRRMFWPGEDPLTWNDIIPYLSNEEDVDTAERGYAYIMEKIAQNPGKFEKTAPQVWGELTPEGCFFIKSALIEQLEAGGFDFAALKFKWIRNGYLYRSETERGLRYKRQIQGIWTNCVRLKMPEEIPTNVSTNSDN